MISNFNIVDGSQQRQVYFANGVNSFHTWNKPPTCQFVHFLILGGGGGGGGGQGGGTATARRGGGSGGSSGGITALVPASYLPDVLYVQVGNGGSSGIGGTTNSNGGSAALSYVMVVPDTGKTASNVLYQSGSAAAGGGASGLNGGTAGTAGSVWTPTGNIFSEFSLVYVFPGQVGVLGQTTVTTPLPVTLSGITSAGGAGAGMNGGSALIGGAVIAGGNIPTMIGGPAGGSATSTTPGGNGSGGYMTFNPNSVGYSTEPLVFLGGAGGGSSDGGVGGAGGNGAYGCGGGGGGAAITNSGGNGGRGGDGIVIITYW